MPLDLGNLQSLPVPGVLSLGETDEMDMYAAPGHTSDGTAFWMPWLGVLVCGDYLSPVEIPMISPGGSAFDYLETLKRLAPVVELANTVIPGHGHPRERDEAQRGLAQDVAYIEKLLTTVTRRCPRAGTPRPSAGPTSPIRPAWRRQRPPVAREPPDAAFRATAGTSPAHHGHAPPGSRARGARRG